MFAKLKAVPAQKAGLIDAVASKYIALIDRRFGEKYDPNGKKWDPIKPSTKRALLARASLSGDGSIPGTLLDRGNPGMHSSLTRATLGNAVVVGFSRPYALYHEFGTKFMARRGLMFGDPNTGQISEPDLKALTTTADKFIRQLTGL